jgi:Carboxymuconolactone decarboxylase family
MTLAPATWSKLVEDERTKIVIEPFVGFFDLGGLAPNESPANTDDRRDADAELIPRMILVLRKLARIRGHTKGALRHGATRQELMEAIWVEAEMRAGGAYAHAAISLTTTNETESPHSG